MAKQLSVCGPGGGGDRGAFPTCTLHVVKVMGGGKCLSRSLIQAEGGGGIDHEVTAKKNKSAQPDGERGHATLTAEKSFQRHPFISTQELRGCF